MRRRNFLKGVGVGAIVPFWMPKLTANEDVLWETAQFEDGKVYVKGPRPKGNCVIFQTDNGNIEIFSEEIGYTQGQPFYYETFRGQLHGVQAGYHEVDLYIVIDAVIGDLSQINGSKILNIVIKEKDSYKMFCNFHWDCIEQDINQGYLHIAGKCEKIS